MKATLAEWIEGAAAAYIIPPTRSASQQANATLNTIESKIAEGAYWDFGDRTLCELTLTDGSKVVGSFTAPRPDIKGAYGPYECQRRAYQDALSKI